ncbi:HD domain-containing protein [Algivirga pacifica]|uniref:HD domain-containing protein n=1 Tax=Algivirga pacifica TaxID=1162670 RepID=A0ABP9D630_9BACT
MNQLQDLYQKAIRFAGEKHANQQVPGTTANYLLHLSNVAMEVMVAYQHDPVFDVQYAVQLALLHDTLEDTDCDLDELSEMFGEAIAEGVAALTKDDRIEEKEEKMKDSLQRILQLTKEVGIVKLADRITNLQPPPSHWSTEKCSRYKQEAKLILNRLGHCNVYLSERLQKKLAVYPVTRNGKMHTQD